MQPEGETLHMLSASSQVRLTYRLPSILSVTSWPVDVITIIRFFLFPHWLSGSDFNMT